MALASQAKLSYRAQQFLNARSGPWTPHWHRLVRRILRQFEARLRDRHILLRSVQREDIVRFCEEVGHSKTREKRLTVIRQYLLWCSRRDPKNTPDLDQLFPKYMAGSRRPLPPIAEQYLAMRKSGWKFKETPFRVRLAVSRLHFWLSARGLRLTDLDRERIQTFVADKEAGEIHSRRYLHRALGQYLDWLSERREIPAIELSGVLPVPWYGRSRTISAGGREYLKFLPAVVKAGTAKCHHSGIARWAS